MGDRTAIPGICYCKNSNCPKMYPSSLGLNLLREDLSTKEGAILPCGHELESIVLSAEAIRDDSRFVKEMDRLGVDLAKARDWIISHEDDLK